MNKKKYFNIAVLVLVYGAFALLFVPFAQAIIFAVLFSFGLNPLFDKIKKKTKLSDLKAITILVLGVVGILFLPLSFIVVRLANSIGKLNPETITQLPIVEKAQYLGARLMEKITSLSETVGFDLGQIDIQSMTGNLGRTVLAVATAIVANIPNFIFQFLVFIAMLYYFMLNQKQLKQRFMSIDVLNARQVQRLINLLEDVCSTVLISSILIAMLQSVIVSTTYFFVGYNDFLFIFVIGFFLAFVPMVGAAPLSLVLIAYSFLTGQYGAGIAFIVAGGIAGTVDNLIRSFIFSSKKDSVSPVISLLAIIGALGIFGILGLFLGPIIPELAVHIGKIVSDNKDSVVITEIEA